MTENAVVSPHHLSAEAGRQVLQAGGNAVDAAIAVVAAQGVVAPETCGVGGDLFALIHAPGWDRPRALNSSGRAGSGVSAENLRMAGYDAIPPDDLAVVTVPGCVDGLVALAEELGRIGLAACLQPAVDRARDGFEASTEQSRAFTMKADTYRSSPAVAPLYPQGRPVSPGDLVRRPALARTLEDIADGGRSAFYEGIPGEDIVRALDGTITPTDLERNQAEWIEPISVEVAGLTAWTIPPNSQGYLGPASLAVFEMLDPPDDPGDPLWWHLLIESYRSLAWERNDLVSDPDHAILPANLLLDAGRLERAAGSISREQAGTWPIGPPRMSGTAYMCVADSEGMSVSIIQSNFHGTGSPFGADRSGFLLHDRGRGFNLMPGHPNELAPGKRPLHTLSPTIWTDGTEPRWTLGTRGGDVQPQLVAQVGGAAILAGASPVEAQERPRWTIDDFGPGSVSSVRVEPDTPDQVVDGLSDRGHTVERTSGPQPGWGPVSIIGVEQDGKSAAADPRVDTAEAIVF